MLFGMGRLFYLCTYVHVHAHTYIVYRTKYSLNALSHDAAIGLIRMVIEDGVNLKEVSLACGVE